MKRATPRWFGVVAALLAGLIVTALVVVMFGNSFPGLRDIQRKKLERYLDAHLPVAVEYKGEVAPGSRYGLRSYLFTGDSTDFRCIASRPESGLLVFEDPGYTCTWAIAHAVKHGNDLKQAFAPWHYEYESFTLTVTVSDAADLPRLADTVAEQLEVVRAPVLSDPDDVFATYFEFDIAIAWVPPGADPRLVASYTQPIGDEPAPGSLEILAELQEAISKP